MDQVSLANQNFYSNMNKWDCIQFVILFLKITLSISGTILLYGVIWYERFSADLRYRTLMNQMLSHLCIFHIIEGPNFLLGFVIFFCFDEQPEVVCHVFIFIGRLLFLCSLTQLLLRQMIKYVYIFHWKYVTYINDDFAALWLIMTNIMLCCIFEFVTYFFGHHNAEISYHFCTGRKPSENIERTISHMKRNGNSSVANVWYKTSLGPGIQFVIMFLIK